MASVVIAAHNEEAVIGRCLDVLTGTAEPGELDVVVVANGCADRTALVARDRDDVVVIETPEPGKSNAIALGDQVCRTFPRLYLDADVDLDTESVRALVKAAAEDGVLAAAPVAHYDLAATGPVAKRFHTVLETLIGERRMLAGAGVYLVTEAGHERVFPMPEVLSDDGWVDRSFTGAERVRVAGARSVVRPARTVGAVVRRRARVRLGNRQLDRLGRPADEPRLGLGELVRHVRAGRVPVLDAGCFLTVLLADRVLTRWRALRNRGSQWSADRTSRSGGPS
ncbi:glycosyl transferase family 2 [Labedaea rhizosphaerae]|uniref:4,4'-diaponeurosporenoate glycosyltransferase n=1 Tax=Labedaea rhizosphaerae TaxID=598644 RepID=A0A4R6SMK6_LABRH|nr:glycosyl transferase family 2 [Labedaea rhizosphaerae]